MIPCFFLYFRYVSKEMYPYDYYPPFCMGAFYMFHISVVEKLFKLFEEEYHRNYLWIEDVYLTGKHELNIRLLIDTFRIRRVGCEELHRIFPSENIICCICSYSNFGYMTHRWNSNTNNGLHDPGQGTKGTGWEETIFGRCQNF